MVVIFCKKHKRYEAKREPKECPQCWIIWETAHMFHGIEVWRTQEGK